MENTSITQPRRQPLAEDETSRTPSSSRGCDVNDTRSPAPVPEQPQHRIGHHGLQVPLAIGTLQWGTTWVDDCIINRTGALTERTCREIVSEVTAAGVALFDTAEGYGGGTSERRLGRLLSPSNSQEGGEGEVVPGKHLLMTKFLPVPWRCFHSDMERAARESCERLRVKCIPFYLLHSPVHWRPIEYWIEAAAICKRKGLIESVGLSNADANQVRRAVAAGRRCGVQVVCNQVHYGLLDYRSKALREMEATCRELGVTIVAFSAIGQGLLADNLTDEKWKSNKPAKMLRLTREDIEPLRRIVREMAAKYNKSMAQIALNWCIQHQVVPLVGCRSVRQAQDSIGCLGWSLDKEDVERLDAMALDRSTLESPAWRRAFFVCLFGIVNLVCRAMDAWGFAKPINGNDCGSSDDDGNKDITAASAEKMKEH